MVTVPVPFAEESKDKYLNNVQSHTVYWATIRFLTFMGVLLIY